MIDSGFAPEREEEAVAKTEGLFADPAPDSSLFDEMTDRAERRGGAISEETMFPADPIFGIGEPSDEPSVAPMDESISLAETEEPEPLDDRVSVSLDGSGALFDPLDSPLASESPLLESALDDATGLLFAPELDGKAPMTTGAFYAASELPCENSESGAQGESDPSLDGSDEPTDGAAAKKKSKKQRPVRELTLDEIALRRSDAEGRISTSKWRFCLAAVLTLFLAVVEIFPSFGVFVTRPLGISRIAGADALLDLQLLLLISLCAYRTVALGVRSVLFGRLRYEGILSLLLLFFVIYDVALYALGVSHGLLCALALAVSLCASVWVETAEAEVERGILELLGDPRGVSAALPFEGKGRLRVARLEHADGFDEHIADHKENAHSRFLLLLGILAVATLALVAAVVLEDGRNPIGVALSGALLALPSGALLARRLYLAGMQRALLARKTALIGESAAYSVARHNVFSIDDTEAFDPSDLKIKLINVFDDFRLDEALRLIAGVYSRLGGVFAVVLSKMCEEAGGPLELELRESCDIGAVADDGVRAVSVGTRAFMVERGATFPPDAEEDTLLLGQRLAALYLALDGAVVARIFVEYTLSTGFENLADQLARLGTKLELRTADPCLSEEYLTRLSSLPRGVLSLCRVEGSELLCEKRTRAESCFFTANRPRSLVGAWLAFRRYRRARRRSEALSVLQLLLGIAMLGVAVFCFETPLLPISLVALYHLLTILISVCGARAFSMRLLADSTDPTPDPQPKGPEL